MKKFKKWMGRVVSVTLYAALIGMVLLVIVSRASGGSPSIFGYQFKSVLSGSMEPGIQTGSIIAIKEGGDMTRFQEGDVITYLIENHNLVTHRVEEVQRDGAQYITKGDMNDGVDASPVRAENIVGMYTGLTIPYVGYMINFAQSKLGNVLLLIVPGLILLGYSGLTIVRALRELEVSQKERTTEST